MNPERKVLLTDGVVGLGALAVGSRFGAPFRWWVVPLAGLTALGAAGVLLSVEQDLLAGTGQTLALAGAFVVLPFLVSLSFMQVRPALGSALALAVCLGTGGGVLGYRFVFGVLGQVPEKRLDRARGRAV